ncbi:hypothetical protein F511_11925 [Dorcoceras hygrometricum]|uniref:Splicing factor 3B subunit 1-like n=1 Tax=Dorcoceras hygrometricum TaxID=472368 RepID=A0A2Z7AIH7_9LAMI|nr:hypothetical protein F511_11925 [Dorcoceras hygrometricum]
MGLTDMNEVPKDLVFDARSAFSADGEQLKTSCKKMEINFEFRLLNDAKTITVKAGSFDVVTHERFLMIAAIHGGVKINWGRLLFNLLKDMGAPDLELGESKAFPPLKILTAKTVGTYIAKNKSINAEEVLEMPVEKMVKKAATKMRPSPAAVEPAAKKKRTTVGRAAPTEKNLALVTVVQDVEPISVVPAVITETAEIETEEMETIEPVVMETTEIETDETESKIDVPSITNFDEDSSLKVLSNEEGPLVETEKEKEKEKEKDKEKEKEKEKMIDSEDTEPLNKVLACTETSTSDEESMSIDDLLAQIPEDMMLPSYTTAEPTKIKFGYDIQIRERYWHKANIPKVAATPKGRSPLSRRWLKGIRPKRCSHAHLISSSSSQSENPNFSSPNFSNDSPMHFTVDDIHEISSSDEVLPVEETTVVTPQVSLPTVVPSTDYTKSFAQLQATVDQISLEQVQTRFHIDELNVALSKKISNLETTFLTASYNQDQVVLVQNNVLRKEMQVQMAALSTELDDICKEIQDHKAAIAHDMIEFHVESKENFQTLSAHLYEIIAYINRGHDDKKGEDSNSRGPQHPEDRSRPGPEDSGR